MNMNRSEARGGILLLSFLAVLALLMVGNKLAAFLVSAACMLAAVWVLYRHLGELTDLSADNPKMKTLKIVTVFDAVLLLLLILFVVLMETGVVSLSGDSEAYLACALIVALMLIFGNISPKLPFSRHTGLRLPWTVSDEDTWVVAHRLLGYLALPAALLCVSGTLLLPSANGRVMFCTGVFLGWILAPSILSCVFYWRKFHGKA